MKKRLTSLFSLPLLLLVSCVVGAPPGFSDGDTWTFPLVAPLENDLLMVPVKINGTGPYLFMIDPDSNVSSIDSGIANDLKLYTVQVPEEVNENDRKVPVFLSEVKSVAIGTLTVRNYRLRVHKFGTYWSGGRVIRGILGRDIIAESLVFAADRDRGVATLATQGNLNPPPGATAVKYRQHFFRRLAKVNVNGTQMTMHVDLASRVSQLWPHKIDQLSLPRVAVRAKLVDEYGAARSVSAGGMAQTVETAGLPSPQILVVPYGDGRMDRTDLDGVLGLNYLARFNFTANWHKNTFWFTPRASSRTANAAERIARWGGVFAGCQTPGCVSATLMADGRQVVPKPKSFPKPPPPPTVPGVPTTPTRQPSQQPPPPDFPTPPVRPMPPTDGPPGNVQQIILQLNRDPRMPDVAFEVLLEAVQADGSSLGFPLIWASVPKGQTVITETNFDASFQVADRFVVVDVGPFPRNCEKRQTGASKCVWVRPLRQ